MIWKSIPFLRILLPFVLGILLWEAFPQSTEYIYWAVGALFLALLIISFNKLSSIAFKRQWIYGLVLNLTLCIFGYILIGSQSNLSHKEHFSHYLNDNSQGLLLELSSPITLKEKTVQAKVKVRQVKDSSSWFHSVGSAMIYFKRDSLSENLEVGDRCLAFESLEQVDGPRNPEVFDYAKYLSRKDIFYSTYISSEKWKLLEKEKGFNVHLLLNRFKQSLEVAMSEAGVTEEAHAVISALTLGDKNELSQELKTTFSRAGVLHILAVSGLHVGIFYLLLNFLLGFMEKIKNGKYIKAVCVIILLWGYVVLTGMSPSVTRAATMFSFVVIGSAMQKHSNVYNTLCVSAFFLLLYQPQSLFNVGFLLSYTAVFGIVYLYPKIYGMWKSKYWLLDKIWVLISVSLAAQIATLPLSLHYFHQFPNYFLLANIIVVPLATGIIYLAIVLFALLPFDFLAKPMAVSISFLVDTLNSFVRWIEGLPFSVTDDIEISLGEVVVIYFLIGSLVLYLNSRKYSYLFAAVTALFLLSINLVIEKVSRADQKRIIVYDVPGHSAFDIIEGTSSVLTTDSSLISDSRTIAYVMKNNWRNMGVTGRTSRIVENELRQGSASIFSVINGQRVLFPLKLKKLGNGDRIKIDIMVLSNKCEASLTQLNKIFSVGKVVLDASWAVYKIPWLIEDCEELGIPCYAVHNSGAYVQDL